MTFQSNGKRWKKIIRNAGVLGGIAAISNLITAGGFSWTALWAGILTGVLVALIEIKHSYNIFPTPKVNLRAQSSFFLS